jgi:predicted anti-sigma-YlaC factor YlaD
MNDQDLTCRDLIEFLADYVEESLPAMQRIAFNEHLAICSDCRAYLDSYRKTIMLARKVGQIESAPELPPSLIRAIRAARGQN